MSNFDSGFASNSEDSGASSKMPDQFIIGMRTIPNKTISVDYTFVNTAEQNILTPMIIDSPNISTSPSPTLSMLGNPLQFDRRIVNPPMNEYLEDDITRPVALPPLPPSSCEVIDNFMGDYSSHETNLHRSRQMGRGDAMNYNCNFPHNSPKSVRTSSFCTCYSPLPHLCVDERTNSSPGGSYDIIRRITSNLPSQETTPRNAIEKQVGNGGQTALQSDIQCDNFYPSHLRLRSELLSPLDSQYSSDMYNTGNMTDMLDVNETWTTYRDDNIRDSSSCGSPALGSGSLFHTTVSDTYSSQGINDLDTITPPDSPNRKLHTESYDHRQKHVFPSFSKRLYQADGTGNEIASSSSFTRTSPLTLPNRISTYSIKPTHGGDRVKIALPKRGRPPTKQVQNQTDSAETSSPIVDPIPDSKIDDGGLSFNSDLQQEIDSLINSVSRTPSKSGYMCPFPGCTKVIKHKWGLKSHIQTHFGDRRHICNICGAGFMRKNDLQRHLKRHTGDRPHTCNGCGRTFSRSDALKKHIASERLLSQSISINLRHVGERENGVGSRNPNVYDRHSSQAFGACSDLTPSNSDSSAAIGARSTDNGVLFRESANKESFVRSTCNGFINSVSTPMTTTTRTLRNGDDALQGKYFSTCHKSRT